jgi:hypothetical protein
MHYNAPNIGMKSMVYLPLELETNAGFEHRYGQPLVLGMPDPLFS